MGKITAAPPNPPFTINSDVGELPDLSLLHSRFTVLLDAGKDIRLNFIDRKAKVFYGTAEAKDQLSDYEKKTSKKIKYAILISYQAYYSGGTPAPILVTKSNDLYWDGTPVQVIIEVKDVGGGTSSTVTDIAD